MNKDILRIMGKRGRITIPRSLREKLGIEANDVLSFSEGSDGQTLIIHKEKLSKSRKAEEGRVRDFLNTLTPAQQRAALVHLSVKWAEDRGGF